jgi:hypothetical protein
MTFQLIKRDGKIKGLVVLFGEGRVVEIVVPRGEMWRICESCGAREALVFCRTHVKYVCGECLRKAPAVHFNCQFISMRWRGSCRERAEIRGRSVSIKHVHTRERADGLKETVVEIDSEERAGAHVAESAQKFGAVEA